LHAQVAPYGMPTDADAAHFRLIAPYELDPRKWDELEWIDLYTGTPKVVSTTGDPNPDVVRIKTYRDVLGLHATHPEPKSLGPDGQPCTRSTRGLLQRRPVTVTTITLIGKESHRLEERTGGLIGDLADIVATYSNPALDPWHTLVKPVLADIPARVLASRTGLHARTIERIQSGKTRPHVNNRAALTLAATDHAERYLRNSNVEIPEDPLAVLVAYRGIHEVARTCSVCGNLLASSRARYCSSACKKRAYRRRRKSRSKV
jgi:hypothetical protein